MHTILHSEYLMLCALAYCYFSKQDIDKWLTKLLIDESPELQTNKERILLKNTLFKKMNYYDNWDVIEKNYGYLFENWKILEIMDRTNNDLQNQKPTGFYAIAFGKYNNDEELESIVCTFRGSELFPIQEAFKDFIETDMLIGIAKKPRQYDQGLEFYKFISSKYDYKIINLAGHSLGGGIAQYVAVMSETIVPDKTFCPNTFTINGIGTLSPGFIEVQSFMKYKEEFFEKFAESEIFLTEYDRLSKIFIPYIMTRCPYIKNSSRVKKIPQFAPNFNYRISPLERMFLIKSIRLAYKNFKLNDSQIEQTINFFFKRNRLFSYLKEAESVLNNFYSNNKYTNVLNYVHSRDFTASFLPHVGTTFEVDKKLKIRENVVKRNFFKQLSRVSVIIEKYHMIDVFTPFISTNAGKNVIDNLKQGDFSNEINETYISSALRKLIYLEKSVNNNLLILYHSRKRLLNDDELELIRIELLNTLKTSAIRHIKYSRIIYEKLECADCDTIRRIWFGTLDKSVSPYKCLDLDDIMVYHYI